MIRGGVTTRVDQEAPYGKSRVRPTTKKKVPFYVYKEKEVFMDTWQEFIDLSDLHWFDEGYIKGFQIAICSINVGESTTARENWK